MSLQKRIFAGLSLSGVLLLLLMVASCVLHFANLGAIGDANTCYMAVVKSMLQSWHNFFFVAAEPGGSVTVDKPPLGLWVEAALAFVLSVEGWVVSLPNILAGIFSVPLLYYLVKKHLGELAGLVAALLVLFLPQQTRRVGEAVPSQPAWAAAMGLGSVLLFITALVVSVLFSLLIVTMLLTTPMIIVILITFAAAAVFGWVGLGTEIGLRLAAVLKTEFPFLLSAGVGTFLLHLVANGFGMIPCLGWVFPTLLSLVSLGAVFLTRFGAHPLSIAATQVSVESVPPARTF